MQMYGKKTNYNQFFIYIGHNVNKNYILIFVGPVGPFNNFTGPILLTCYPFSYINLHVKYGINHDC